MAAMTGATRESVARCIARFRHAGRLDHRNCVLQVRDADALERVLRGARRS
jgi:hypothetical protein